MKRLIYGLLTAAVAIGLGEFANAKQANPIQTKIWYQVEEGIYKPMFPPGAACENPSTHPRILIFNESIPTMVYPSFNTLTLPILINTYGLAYYSSEFCVYR